MSQAMERPTILYEFYLTQPIQRYGCTGLHSVILPFLSLKLNFIQYLRKHCTITSACTVMLHGTILICMIHNMGQCTCPLVLGTVVCISIVIA